MNLSKQIYHVPDEFDIPEGFTLADAQHDPDKKFYVSKWYDGIAAAKKAIDAAAQFYTNRNLKFLFFREIRKPSKKKQKKRGEIPL